MTKVTLSEDYICAYTDYTEKDKCKSILSAEWDKVKKCWKYPKNAVLDVLDIFPNAQVSDAVLELKRQEENRLKILDDLISHKIEPRKHEFLMYHQRVCRDIAEQFDRFALFLDTGTGKTLTSLQIIEDKNVKFLVICPKSIIKTAWLDDQQKFFPNMRLLPISRNMLKEDYLELAENWKLNIPYDVKRSKNKVKEYLEENAQVYVINPESFKADLKNIESLDIEGLVIDESTIIKNPSSQITKEITKFSDKLKYVYILSGKPAPNNSMEYHSQMRVVDESVLGKSFFKFRSAFYNQTGYLGFDWQPKPDAEQKIADRLKRRTIFIKKEDCLDLPEKTYLIRKITLPPKAKKHYLEMEKMQVLLLEDKAIAVPSKLAGLMKLRQITSGFVLDTAYETTELIHNSKINELELVLDEIGDKQVIIWVNFKAEVALISETLKNRNKTFVTAYSGTKNVDDSIKKFKNNEVQYIIAHPQTLKYGVTFTNCTYAIYYSLSYSLEDYYQSHDRIYRKGQTQPCTFIFLLAEKTIDEVIYKTLKNKGSKAEIIENMIRHY